MRAMTGAIGAFAIHRGAALRSLPVDACTPADYNRSMPIATFPRRRALAVVACVALACSGVRAEPHVWLDAKELADLPMQGPAWQRLQEAARAPMFDVQLANQEDRMHMQVLAKALVAARTGDATRRYEVESAILTAMGTQVGGRTLALARNLGTLVIAADLVGLSPDADQRFRQFLGQVMDEELDGMSLRQMHERRPNNWGTHAS